MTRSTASWTTAIAASALLAVPVGAMAQTSRPTRSQSAPSPKTTTSQHGSAPEHLRQAEAALNDIPAASLTGNAKTRLAELKRHLNALGTSATGSTAGATGASARGNGNWSRDVAAADRILTELLGASETTGAMPPAATGAPGATPATVRGKSATAVTLDGTSRTKLHEVRTHLTAFAASMSGSGGSASATTSSDDPSAGASAATPSASASPSATRASSPQTSPSSPAEAGAANEATTASNQPPAPSAATDAARPAQPVDTATVKKHLSAARDTLSQLTQQPAAAQLTGDARAQVSQLISNFNELITTETSWRASYAKVQSNLATLVSEPRADESAAPAAGTAGAVGTSGTTALDPAIRAKLIEFRAHLLEFEKAAGDGASTASSSGATAPGVTAATEAPSGSTPVGTSGTTAAPAPGTSPTAAAGTDAAPRDPSATPQGTAPQQGLRSQADVLRHLEAIEAILNGTAATGAESTGRSTLDRAQIDEIRTHLRELRKALPTSGK